uniref:CRAL-TRIO domain-containing protein n=1 Tax=Arion vulgaris TaxID=1028688 RepID=A0A0B7AAM4_9EUPU
MSQILQFPTKQLYGFSKPVNGSSNAEKALLNTIEYRRQTKPLTSDCQWCHDRPGFHSMRQVGHDEAGRPVVYANFGQASIRKNSVEDIVAHVTYLIENAKVTMENGVSTWVFVIDCSGMTLSACNPKLGYGTTNILANHYPERLGLVVCVNHSSLFHGVWKALKKLLSPGTVSKVKLVRSEAKIQQLFSNYFSLELANWLLEEITLNRQKPISIGQREFGTHLNIQMNMTHEDVHPMYNSTFFRPNIKT